MIELLDENISGGLPQEILETIRKLNELIEEFNYHCHTVGSHKEHGRKMTSWSVNHKHISSSLSPSSSRSVSLSPSSSRSPSTSVSASLSPSTSRSPSASPSSSISLPL